MQPVIYPIEKKKLIAELTEEHFMRKTNKEVVPGKKPTSTNSMSIHKLLISN